MLSFYEISSSELRNWRVEQNLSWKTEEAAAAEAFLSRQLENIRHSLEKAGRDLAEFKKTSKTIVLSEEAKAMIAQASMLEQQRVAARLEVESLQHVNATLRKGGLPTEAYLVGEAQDTVLMSMSQALVKAQQEYKSASQENTAEHPAVKKAQAEVDAQLHAVQSYVTNRLKRAQELVSSLDSVIGRYADKLRELPDAELRLATLTQETDVYSKLYQFLLERQQQAALTKASTISKSRVLDAPVLPIRETSPKVTVRAAIGLTLGLFLGIGFVLARWRFATTFRSEGEVRKMLPGLAPFASIPRQSAVQSSDEVEVPRSFDLLASDLRSPFAEAFRLLRTNIYYSGSLKQEKVIVISSPGPGEGKTLTTLCLAGILVADGKRVLVVDGDMRKPSHHILLRQRQHPGLSGILTNETPWSAAVHDVRTPFGELHSICTGIVPPNPAELLSSPHLSTFLSEAREMFDFILLDSPPFPLVSDALVLSHHADRILTVLRIGTTDRRIAEEHVRRLSEMTSRYGVVINDVTGGRAYGYAYGYGARGYGVPTESKRTFRPWRRKKHRDPNQTSGD